MRKQISLLLIASFMLQMMGCSSVNSDTIPEAAEGRWLNCDIDGNVTADMKIRPQDNFSAAVNQDWIVDATLDAENPKTGAIYERTMEVRQQVIDLMEGEPLESHEGQQSQTLYQLYMDMESRNKLGTEPLKEILEDIDHIATVEELTGYLMRSDIPFRFLNIDLSPDILDSTEYAAYTEQAEYLLGNPDEYNEISDVGKNRKAALGVLLPKLYAMNGYTAEQAKRDINIALSLETEMAHDTIGTNAEKQSDYIDKSFNKKTLEEIEQLQGEYPFSEFLSSFTEGVTDTFVVTDLQLLNNMSQLYNMEHLEDFKALLRCQTLMATADMLNQDSLNALDEYNSTLNGIEIHTKMSDGTLWEASNAF